MKRTILSVMGIYFSILSLYAQDFSGVKKGDILEVNGTKGIVFRIDEDGIHGTMMSINAFRGVKNAWCFQSKYVENISADSKTDGMKNTQAVYDYASNNHIDLQEFPVFAWCNSLGEGWYIPAVSQLEQFINYWLGNDNELDWDEDDESDNKIDENLPHPKLVNTKLLDAGGIAFTSGVYTSTKDKKGDVYTYYYHSLKKWWKFCRRNPMNLDRSMVGRAFYNF